MFSGQSLVREEHVNRFDPWYKRALVRYRRIIAPAIPTTFYLTFWVALMIKYNLWHIFTEKYHMTLTMIVGGTVAGKSNEDVIESHDKHLNSKSLPYALHAKRVSIFIP